MLFDQQRYLTSLLRRLFLALIATIALLFFTTLFFALQYLQASHLEHIFLITGEQTLAAHRAPCPYKHSQIEIHSFAQWFLQKAFAINEYTWDQQRMEVTTLMDQPSAQLFRAKMDPSIEALYKEHNAISTVSLQHIEINTDQAPYEVLLYYDTLVRFASGAKALYQEQAVAGGLYFQLQPLVRCYNNPYGLQIRNLKFLQKQQQQQ